jgi:Carboxypeptidase regulatory-like domain
MKFIASAFSMRVHLFRPIVLLACLSATALQAQDPVGAIEGSVTDSSGGSVAARIVVKNLDTDSTRGTSADPGGAFRMAQIPIGRYRVTVEAEHFATVVQEPVTVNISQNLHLHFTLELS